MKIQKGNCSGCGNDFYNSNVERGCWSFKNAKMVKVFLIHRDESPPYKNKKLTLMPSCWYGNTGMRCVDPKNITKEGYWK